MPYLEARTPYSDDHAACRGWQDAGAISAGPRTISRTTATPDAMPHSVLPIVFGHCTPAIQGKTTTSTPPLMYTAPPCDYKRRRRASFKRTTGGTDWLTPFSDASGHQLPRSPTFTIIAIPDSSSSRDLGASLPLSPRLYPYYKHSGCKIIQCPRTPPLLDVRPRGRNQDKPCVTVLPLASSSGTRKHAAFTSWDPGPRVGTPTLYMITFINSH